MLSQIRTNIQSWWQQTPLPTNTAPPSFQKWHIFDQDQWISFVSDGNSQPDIKHQLAGSFRLVTWNVNADALSPKSRISALLEVIKTTGAVNVIFLQEVSKDALTALLEEPWIQKIAPSGEPPLPSRFGRDALCCDLILNSSSKHIPDKSPLQIRLINVHLDSLPINPSLRPHQLSICTSYLSTAGRGIIGGDFNPVLPEDDGLVYANYLIDAWECIHPNDAGHTWGVYGEHVFPPNRFDKVTLFNLTPSAMGILRTSEVESHGEKMSAGGTKLAEKVQFSDHFGVWCEVRWEENRAQSE
ncbi:hypothetical protein COCMIDRAFT_32089 [Bipolaris oryzae ATCC 44560]|uniref:Endonuclease/exonuclease/phosphatase domain-containing protein n=1 Tax=Bipolaris oryzae ATCC 44560 TaxID=930090 RepID=W6ZKP5_COCMI|nr:uncharacterized protein COCMIDRAFT_32089 [Bipolaris oryzae ATCC 44560]EUC50568.1 hypothetical protein COCMIDRAFT_32089 [Bipolaris oryzae ATCC 44560]